MEKIQASTLALCNKRERERERGMNKSAGKVARDAKSSPINGSKLSIELRLNLTKGMERSGREVGGGECE